MSSTFCIAPWQDIHITTNGKFKGCCVMSEGPNNGYLATDGKNHSIQSGDIKSAMNSDTSKEIRKSCLNDDWHPECIRCEREENAGMNSMRLIYNTRWEDIFSEDDARKITEEDGSIPEEHEPFFYDIQLGNFCNLKCRICNLQLSSTWYADWMAMKAMQPTKERPARNRHIQQKFNSAGQEIQVTHISGKQYEVSPDIYAWANSKEFWSGLSDRKETISHLYLIGGEPMMIPKELHLGFLKECVESGDAERITLQYDTNMTNIPDDYIEVWKKFKHVLIGFSIDGMGKQNEYMRAPSKWSHVIKNLHKLDDAVTTGASNIELNESITISIYNILHILDFLEWKITTGRYEFKNVFQKCNNHMFAHPLHDPEFLNTAIIPANAKKVIIQKYEDWRIKMHDWIGEDDNASYSDIQTMGQLRNTIDAFVNSWHTYLSEHMISNSEEKMQKFWEYNQQLDELRSEKFIDIFPDLNEILS
jgi:MoaA/NifB/PqqE/SkfB family radical SAM enzyme